MALPVLKIDSATGSDSAASGAGPTTALTGTTGVSAADGLTIDLSADSPDLSGVDTTGLAVINFIDTNAGSRNFAKITAVNNTTKVVTVSDAVRASQTKSWAIGGKLASIGSTTSKKLFDNNSAAGDAMPGWIVELQSGHSETNLAATLNFRRSGDQTSGLITLRGASGAATLPLLEFTNNGLAIGLCASYLAYRDFEIRNSNGTKTASVAFGRTTGTTSNSLFDSIKINKSDKNFWKGFVPESTHWKIHTCDIGYCANVGIDFSGIPTEVWIMWNWIHNCTSHGISQPVSNGNHVTCFNLITANGGDGINNSHGAGGSGPYTYIGNTIDGNTGDGFEMTATSAQMNAPQNMLFANNILSNNGGYGINFSGSGLTEAVASGAGALLINNQTYNNTSGATNGGASLNTNDSGLNPTYTNTGGNDYSLGTNLKAKAHPIGGTTPVGKYGSTYSYVDPGAAERQEVAAGVNARPLIIQNIGTY